MIRCPHCDREFSTWIRLAEHLWQGPVGDALLYGSFLGNSRVCPECPCGWTEEYPSYDAATKALAAHLRTCPTFELIRLQGALSPSEPCNDLPF